MASSIRKRITDELMARLAGDTATPFPSGIGNVKIDKNRRIPVGPKDLPLYSLYFIQDPPTPVGDPRKPTLMKRILTLETRIITDGTDDEADAHCQWVTMRMATAGQLTQPDGTNLALSIVESQTDFEAVEGSTEERTITRIQWLIEYRTRPDDITKVA